MRNGRGGAERPRLALSWLAVALVVVIGCWFGLSSTMFGRDGSPPRAAAQAVPPSAPPSATPSVADAGPQGEARVSQFPPAGVGDFPTPLGRPPKVTGGQGQYRFVLNQKGSRRPVAYDPCRQIRFVIRSTGAPAGGRAAILQAIGQISAATGLQFVDEGDTREAPSKKRRAYQPKRYGERWAPVLIAWQTPEQNPDFATDVAGEAGSTPVSVQGQDTVFVTGQVRLDAGKLGDWLRQAGGAGAARALILHELGHLVGLDHVNDRSQVMFPQVGPEVPNLAAGDRRGLARLGAGRCAPYL